MEYLKSLPKTDLILLMEIVHNLISVRTTNRVESCFKQLQNLFLHDSSFCALLDIDTLRKKKPLYCSCTMNFSEEFVKRYANELYYVNSAVFNAVLTNYQPCHWKTYWSKNSDEYNISAKKLACSYGYKDGWICTTRYQQDPSFGLLIFSGQKVDADTRTESIIKYITPHFSESIKATFDSSIIRLKQIARYKLTPRELEVLKWIKEGKSMWDISTIFNRSERVVKWHAKNIKQKLEAQNLAHAVAIAMRYKLID